MTRQFGLTLQEFRKRNDITGVCARIVGRTSGKPYFQCIQPYLSPSGKDHLLTELEDQLDYYEISKADIEEVELYLIVLSTTG